ncbi:MAG: hypothetical protein Kow006_32830 [Gammaproteobacteria bacterium]
MGIAAGYAIGGAAAGYVNGYVLSGNSAFALKGALSGALFGGVGGYYGSNWSIGRIGVTSIVGGASSEIYGGRFRDGFRFSFFSSASRYIYNNALGYDVTWERGKGLANQTTGLYDEANGVPFVPNVIGTNTEKLVWSNGKLEFWSNFWKQGGLVSESLNKIPGLNSLAKLHDYFQIGLDRLAGGYEQDSWLRQLLNVPAMVPATAMSYGALLNNHMGFNYHYSEYNK